jgi:hypothetical protein
MTFSLFIAPREGVSPSVCVVLNDPSHPKRIIFWDLTESPVHVRYRNKKAMSISPCQKRKLEGGWWDEMRTSVNDIANPRIPEKKKKKKGGKDSLSVGVGANWNR